jgi:outer membrane biosynthesis protein TonB
MANEKSRQKKKKVLRIGLFQNHRIIEERLLRTPQSVTIGTDLKKNTFVVPASNLPKSFPVFAFKDGKYILQFDDKMSGRVKVGDTVATLQELVEQGKAKRSGNRYSVVLSPSAQGRVVIGEATLLFQFVTPPPPRPKPVLPASMRGGFLAGVGATLIMAIAFSALFQIGFVVFLETRDWPKPKEADTDIPDRFVRVMVEEDKKEKKPEPEKKEKDEGEGDESAEKKKAEPAPEPKKQPEKKPSKPEKKKSEMTPEERAKARAERRKRLSKEIENKTVIGVIGAKSSEGGTLVDTLKQGAGKVSADEAFAGSQGVKTDALGAERSGLGAPGGSDADGKGGSVDIGELERSSGAAEADKGVKTAEKKQKKVTAKLDLKEPPKTGGGEINQATLKRKINARRARISACYERELKKNPKAAGKVVVSFEIGRAGRVTKSTATTDSVGSGVGRCVAGVIKRIRFPRPKGGPVLVNKSFVFEPGG